MSRWALCLRVTVEYEFQRQSQQVPKLQCCSSHLSSVLLIQGGIFVIIGNHLIRMQGLVALTILAATQTTSAQTLGSNLIVNGDAEKGPAGTISVLPTSI